MAAMDDSALTEDEMLAQAISLSLGDQEFVEGAAGRPPGGAGVGAGAGAGGGLSSPGGGAPASISRSDTNQSQDSLLNDSWATGQGRQVSHDTGVTTSVSVSSSPDLGISAESEMDSQLERRGDEDDVGDEIQACGHQPLNVDGGTSILSAEGRASAPVAPLTIDGVSPPGSSSHQLPLARLSSLHDQYSSQGSLPSPQKEWQPNKQCLELIVGMGISENAAKRALFYTGNDNAELAVAWVFENIENPELHTHFEPPSMITLHNQTAPMGPGPVFHSIDELLGQLLDDEVLYKMVFVVNVELKMSTGKIAAQVGHATLGLYKYLQSQQDQRAGLEKWEERGSKKIVLRGNDVRHMLDLKKKAYELHIANIMVHDAGKTEVEPGSLTVFALFGKNEDVDKVTGSLKLL